MRPTILVLSAVALAGCGKTPPSPLPPPTGSAVPQDDASRLQGLWTANSVRHTEGQPDEMPADLSLRFEGSSYHMLFPSQDVSERGSFTLNPAAGPKHLDLEKVDGESRELRRGLYALDGDKLTVCIPDHGGAARPTEMKASAEGSAVMVIVFTRSR